MTKYTISMFNCAGPLNGKEPIGGLIERRDNLVDAQLFADGEKMNWKFVSIYKVDKTGNSEIIVQFVNGKKQQPGSTK